MKRPTALLLALVLLPPAAALQDGEIAPPPIEMEPFVDETGAEALRGVFRVHEDRENGTGKLLELDFVVLLATGLDPRPDPIFMFAGGPGQAVTTTVRGGLRSWMREERDIVYVDQRGTGGNHALRCETAGSTRDPQGYLDPLFDPQQFRRCLDELSRHADLRMYSTPIAMDDVDALREALGYERINVMGGSYGTRAALVYMRRHPERVRTAVLNGVAPLSFTNPLHHAREAQDGLQRILEECAADPDCSAAYPRLEQELAAVFARVDAGPVEVPLLNRKSGKVRPVRLDRDAFAEALRVMMYYTQGNRQVPHVVHRAYLGDFTPFAERGLAVNRGVRDSLALGMLLSVTCAEDVARIDPETIPAYTDGTFYGDTRVRGQIAVCEFWPRSELPDDYGDPVSVDVPTLILSGTHDPVTSPRQGAEAARHLPRSLHVVVPGAHGVGGPCVDSIVRRFHATGSVEGIDTSCVAGMSMPPFQLPSAEERALEELTWTGRGSFVPTPPELPASIATRGGELRGTSRYDIPLQAAAPRAGQVVADVGCASGKFSFRLAESVGPDGAVFCRDVDANAIQELRARASELGVTNIDAATSEPGSVALPEAAIDLALLSDVYHVVIDQEATTDAFVKSLFVAMKPGGIVVVTFVTTSQLFQEDEWRPTFDQTVADFTRHGFEAGRRVILQEEKRPALVLEFRRPR